MRKQYSVQTIQDIDAEIAQLQETKAALLVLQNNGYRVDKVTDSDGSPRYSLRPLNSRSKPNVKTCTNHPWRPVTDGVHCRLCIRQARMKERWDAIRPALATISRSGRKGSPTTLRTPATHAGNQQPVSTVPATTRADAIHNSHLVVVLNFSETPDESRCRRSA